MAENEIVINVILIGLIFIVVICGLVLITYLARMNKRLTDENFQLMATISTLTAEYNRAISYFETLNEYIEECETRHRKPVMSSAIIKQLKTFKERGR